MRRNTGWNPSATAVTSSTASRCLRGLTALILFAAIGCSGGYSSSSSEPTAAPEVKSSVPPSSSADSPKAPTTPVETPATAPSKVPATAVSDGAGREPYLRFCAMCHGSAGQGDGPLAASLNPKPRGFVDEPWRFIDASTPQSTRIGLARVISEGLASSGMPGFARQMSEEQIAAVVEYVLSLQDS